jgi:DeoR/GlpR family transcriptional regulator of sugar metabolism
VELSPQRGRNAAKRREWITVALRTEGFLSIAELTHRLDVSHMTIRRDLQYLEEIGHVRMVHGGASLSVAALNNSARWVSPAATDETQIGRTAATLVGETDIIAIDAGRLGYEVAKGLPDSFRGTVITNSIPVIQLLISRLPAPRVVGVGGEVMTDNYAFVGASALASIARVRVDTLFLAIDALDERGVYAHTDAEASVKRAFIDIADRTVVVAGHDCFTDSAPLMLDELNCAATLVTDWRPGKRIQRALQEAKVDMLIAAGHETAPQPGMESTTRLHVGIHRDVFPPE